MKQATTTFFLGAADMVFVHVAECFVELPNASLEHHINLVSQVSLKSLPPVMF